MCFYELKIVIMLNIACLAIKNICYSWYFC